MPIGCSTNTRMLENVTSVTVAVHRGFGHASAPVTMGASVTSVPAERMNRPCRFGKTSPVEPSTVSVWLCPGTGPVDAPGLKHSTSESVEAAGGEPNARALLTTRPARRLRTLAPAR